MQNLHAALFLLSRAVDQYPAHVTKQDVEKVLAKGRSGTGGLDSVVFMKEGARVYVMLTTSIDIVDRLINGQIGTTVKVAIDQNAKPTTVYVKFDDDKADSMTVDKSTDSYAKQNGVVPTVLCQYWLKLR